MATAMEVEVGSIEALVRMMINEPLFEMVFEVCYGGGIDGTNFYFDHVWLFYYPLSG